jgi:hypothetical protein
MKARRRDTARAGAEVIRTGGLPLESHRRTSSRMHSLRPSGYRIGALASFPTGAETALDLFST